jgi:hypothetical protein
MTENEEKPDWIEQTKKSITFLGKPIYIEGEKEIVDMFLDFLHTMTTEPKPDWYYKAKARHALGLDRKPKGFFSRIKKWLLEE